jgi:hypothetical protein
VRELLCLTELPPREVLETNLKATFAMHKERARVTDGREMKETVPKGMWRMREVDK